MLLTALIGLGIIVSFNVIIDPYDNFRLVRIDGVTHPKLKLNADGARVSMGFKLLRDNYSFLMLGSSRVGRGMPFGNLDGIDHQILNAGLPSINIYELVRAGLLGLDNPNLQCVLIGLDFNSFSEVGKIKGAYAHSPLAGGPVWLTQVKVALTAKTLSRSQSTLSGNLRGKELPGVERGIERLEFAAGQQRQMYQAMQDNWVQVYAQHVYDPRRVDYLGALVDHYRTRGLAVVGMISPLHAWQEEIIWRTDRQDDYRQWRRDLARIFPNDLNNAAHQNCFADGLPSLIDPAGFRTFATIPAPSSADEKHHPTFYETSHYNLFLGAGMLRMTQDPDGQFAHGLAIHDTTVGTDAHWLEIEKRRDAWLVTDDALAAIDRIEARLEGMGDLPAPARFSITDEDFRIIRDPALSEPGVASP